MGAVDYRVLDPLKNKGLLRECLGLARQRLGKCRSSRVLATLKLHTQRLLVLACEGERVLGFKLGFAERDGIFYSWLGAVSEQHERRGIGRGLQEAQHRYLVQNGYRKVRTRTSKRFERMLMLNLRSGFEIVGMTTRAKQPLLLLEKSLLSGR